MFDFSLPSLEDTGQTANLSQNTKGVQLKPGKSSREGIQNTEVSQELDSVSCLLYSAPRKIFRVKLIATQSIKKDRK